MCHNNYYKSFQAVMWYIHHMCQLTMKVGEHIPLQSDSHLVLFQIAWMWTKYTKVSANNTIPSFYSSSYFLTDTFMKGSVQAVSETSVHFSHLYWHPFSNPIH